MQELFPIFPPDALLQRAQDRITTTSIAIRSCRTSCSRACPARYSAADYQAEVDRLAALDATYDTTLFRLPAYIWMLHDTDNSEYVLLEESTRTIHYIACQTDELAALAMPEGWYPGESLRAVRIAPPEGKENAS